MTIFFLVEDRRNGSNTQCSGNVKILKAHLLRFGERIFLIKQILLVDDKQDFVRIEIESTFGVIMRQNARVHVLSAYPRRRTFLLRLDGILRFLAGLLVVLRLLRLLLRRLLLRVQLPPTPCVSRQENWFFRSRQVIQLKKGNKK